MHHTRNLSRTCSPAFALVIAFVGATSAQADDASARGIMKAMSDYLAAQTALSFDYDASLEVVTTDDQKLAIASSGSVALERPGKLHATRHGGFASVEAMFDGTTLSVLNTDANVYAQADVPGTVDSLIDTLRNDFHIPLPAADLLLSDVGSELMPLVNDAKDLGSGVIGGAECDHVAFRTKDVDMQIWIAQGAAPYPCRYVITNKAVAGWPEYTVTVLNWGKGSAHSDFTFKAPAAATKVEVKAVPNLDELSGIFAIKGAN